MQLINIGFGNMISSSKLVAIVSPESAPIKRIDSDHIILSAIQPETVAARLDEEEQPEDE